MRFEQQLYHFEGHIYPPHDMQGMMQPVQSLPVEIPRKEQEAALAQVKAHQENEVRLRQSQGRELTAAEAEVRASYLTSRPVDISRRVDLLRTMGIEEISISADGTRIEQLTLPASNYVAFHQLMAQLGIMAELPKSQWDLPQQGPQGMVEGVSSVTPMVRLQAILQGSEQLGLRGMPFFKTLFSEQIVVSAAHQGTSPGMHTYKVFDLHPIDHFKTSLGKVLAMMSTLLHDLGKGAQLSQGGLANKDQLHDHAHVSAYIVEELVREFLSTSHFGFDDKDARQVAKAVSLIIKYHHTFEVVEKGIITLDEFLAIIYDAQAELDFTPILFMTPRQIEQNWRMGNRVTADEILTYLIPAKIVEHIAALTNADRRSADLNSVFTLTALKLMRQMVHESTMPTHLIPRFQSEIKRTLAAVWEGLHAMIGLNQAANPQAWVMLNRVLPDFAGVGEPPVSDEANLAVIWLRWLTQAQPPTELEEYLVGRLDL